MRSFWAGCLSLSIFLSLISPAFAALGDHVSSVQADRQAFHGSVRSMAHSRYQVQEITGNQGYTIREYVSNSGVVFAVAWNGMGEPDLTKLLGSYDQQYQKAQKHVKRPSRRAPEKITGSDLIVEKGGHMRDIHGRAYVPSLIPAGVSLQDIQ